MKCLGVERSMPNDRCFPLYPYLAISSQNPRDTDVRVVSHAEEAGADICGSTVYLV